MKRFILITLVAFAILTAIVTIKDAKTQAEWEENREIITVIVEKGDTLDGYWAEYAPNWMSREQYRTEIMELNNMKSCGLSVGNKIKLYVD
jgi:hypothetical protein